MIKRILDQLIVYDVEGYSKKRIGNKYDGGYVILDKAFEYAKMYSFGIGNDISFEANFMVEYTINVYLCDPTIYRLPFSISGFQFKQEGLRGIKNVNNINYRFLSWIFKNLLFHRPLKYDLFNFINNKLKVKIASKVRFDSLEGHLLKDGNINCRNMFLKIDIEGDEFEAILVASEETLKKFGQIIIEVHHIGDVDFFPLERQILFFEKLNAHHRIVHVHHNNWSKIKDIDGYKVPEVLEFTFLRKDENFFFKKTKNSFPTEFDYPNTIVKKDEPLDFYPFK